MITQYIFFCLYILKCINILHVITRSNTIKKLHLFDVIWMYESDGVCLGVGMMGSGISVIMYIRATRRVLGSHLTIVKEIGDDVQRVIGW